MSGPAMSGHRGPPVQLQPLDGLPLAHKVTLSCGHVGLTWGPPKDGLWVSCWAVVVNGGGRIRDACQCQRQVVRWE
jgi:hypothetical protein